MGETFTTEIQARYRDINLAGHVDNVDAVEPQRLSGPVSSGHMATRVAR